jgi:hypothetical protein
MSGGRSLNDLMAFLDWNAEKGMMAPATVQARKAAVGKVLGVLSEDEVADVTGLDLESVMARFHNLQGRNYTTDSLITYKSRVRSTLDEFASYLDNPLGYRPNNPNKERKPRVQAGRSTSSSPRPSTPASETLGTGNILPIQVRPDLVVRIQGIPFDLTETEARRIANVIIAMANPG